MNFKLGCLLLFVLVIGAPAVASKYLPWWGTLLFIAGEGALLLFGLPLAVKFGVKRMALGMFDAKSRVLRGAMVQVHSVALTTAPPVDPELEDESDDEDDESDEDDEVEGEEDDADDPTPLVKRVSAAKRYVLLDFTLTPRPGASKMSHWEPDELLLVPFDADISVENDSHVPQAHASKMSLVNDDGSETDDFNKVVGKAHLRAVFACPSTLRGRAKLRYYFEGFGDVMLP